MRKWIVLVAAFGLVTVPLSLIVVECSNSQNHQKIDISTNKDVLSVDVNKSEQLTITNFAELKNVQVKLNAPTDIVKINGEVGKTIIFEGLKVGATTLTITAANANSKVITINVNKLEIKTDSDKLALNVGGKEDLTITNFAELENVQVKLNAPTDIVKINGEVGKSITVEGLKVGATTLIITAANTDDRKVITINVTNLSIITDKERAVLTIGSPPITDFVTITNFQELENVTIDVKNPSIATAIINKNEITLEPQKMGDTILMIRADNAADKEIIVEVNKITNEGGMMTF